MCDPLSVQFLSFLCSFRKTSCQIKGFRFKIRAWRPLGNPGYATAKCFNSGYASDKMKQRKVICGMNTHFRHGKPTIHVKGAEPPPPPARFDRSLPRGSTHIHPQKTHPSRPFILFLDRKIQGTVWWSG